MDPNDRMNPNMPVQLFMDDPPPVKKRARIPLDEGEPGPSHGFNLKSRLSPDREWMFKGDGKRPKEDKKKPKGDGRFYRVPELVVCNRRKRNVASSICDMITHFLRTAANIVVHRFSNYGRDDPASAFVDKFYQGIFPYKFCTIREVRDYIDSSMYGIRDELRPQKVESVCFAIVNDLEESLLEVTVDLFQTKKFWNRRLRGCNPKPLAELRPQLLKAILALQQLQISRKEHRKLLRTPTSLTIRYATIDAGEEEDDETCPEGWDPIFPTPPEYAGKLYPWVEPIRTEFNQMQFHVLTGQLF
ncbi:hypothetical protein PENTCL1PPCAC_21842 [Pristionchus entomophagus]|uniref:Uncharacterized protein n=1 Tax=Pristionchus entomophagus TaxID=358040 RepID=A0AAV5TZP8_9BILA|nr:hypothetical protein PENTCL1PPCAC_21842 [Pristionchus entomophagus]